MWSLHRAALPLKKHGSFLGFSRVFRVKPGCLSNLNGDKASRCYPAQLKSTWLFSKEEPDLASLISRKFILHSGRPFSQVRKNTDENDVKDAFLELKKPLPANENEDINVEEEVEEELILEPRFLDENLSDLEEGPSMGEPLKDKNSIELLRTIKNHPSHFTSSILDKFVGEGKYLSQMEASKILFSLHRHQLFTRALQFSEWVENTNHFKLTEKDYASCLDLIAKVKGVDMAEKYMEKVPASFKGELLHRTLLANCVYALNTKKAVAIFEKMKKLGFPITIYTCNQMIILYRRIDRRKIDDILLLMDKENLKPSHLTYRVLVAIKSQAKDTMGMEQLAETMKSQGLQPDIHVMTVLASHYMSIGLKDKAIAILKEIEAQKLKESTDARSSLLFLYASLDMADDVSRIWNYCKLNQTKKESLAAIAAWGRLGNVEEAESVFEMTLQKWEKKLSSKHYAELLRVYIQHGQISKGKEFIKRMEDSRCYIGPLVWDGLVRLYVADGDLRKADSILNNAAQKNKVRPLFNSYLFVMEQYAKQGDIHNTEKWFHRMKQCGYTGRLRPFEILIEAYIKAKTPVYGLRERMKAENVFPNKAVGLQMAKITIFEEECISTSNKQGRARCAFLTYE